MNLRHGVASALRRTWPVRTVRSRLALLYGGLFLATGSVLLLVTTALWGTATGGPITIPLRSVSRIASIPSFILKTPHAPFHRSIFRKALQRNLRGFTRVVRGGGSPVRPPRPPAILQQIGRQLRIDELQEHSNDLHHLLLYSGITLGGMAVLSLILGWLVGGRILRPLRTITATTREISASNLHERLGLGGPLDELKELGDTIDQLLNRLESSFEAQRQFVTNASHELRTPLATMRASIDVALAKPGPMPPATEALAGRLSAELDHVEDLLESLLSLARAERGAGDASSSHAVADLVDSSLRTHAPALAAAAIEVEIQRDHTAVVAGNAVLLARMVDNIVDNAVRHNEIGGFIRVTTERHGDTAHLVVENGGETMSQETVASIPRPFRRAGAERTGSDTGLGLGLPIIAAVAQSHGGSLRLTPRESGGLRVEIELPLERQLDRLVTA